MTGEQAVWIGVATGGALLLAAVFAAYRNPLFQIYLANWGLC